MHKGKYLCGNWKPPKRMRCKVCGRLRKNKYFYIYKRKERPWELMVLWQCKSCRLVQNKQYRKNNPRKMHHKMIFNKYNLTEDQYEAMLVQQYYCCAICGKKHQDKNYHRLTVDHSHKTGKVRRLLCRDCNIGLGVFRDNLTFLQSAISYLKENE